MGERKSDIYSETNIYSLRPPGKTNMSAFVWKYVLVETNINPVMMRRIFLFVDLYYCVLHIKCALYSQLISHTTQDSQSIIMFLHHSILSSSGRVAIIVCPCKPIDKHRLLQGLSRDNILIWASNMRSLFLTRHFDGDWLVF